MASKRMGKKEVYSAAAGAFITILCLIILGGCAKKDAVNQLPDEDVLRARVQTYWGHVVAEEFDKSYELEHPLYRKNVSMVEYLRGINNNVKWTRVEIKQVTIEKDVADIVLVMDTKIVATPLGGRSSGDADMIGLQKTDRWSRVDGAWYHVPKKLRANN